MHKGTIYYGSGTIKTAASDNSVKWYKVQISASESATEWTFVKNDTDGFTIDKNRIMMWSNVDVPNGSATSTTIYFNGSEPVPQIEKKYLIRDGVTYYNIVDGALNEITVTDLTAQVFTDSGMEYVPSGDLITALTEPEVLMWCDDDTVEISATAAVTATPYPQTVERTITVVHESITGIENAVATVEGSPIFSCSFDGGTTYEAHNGTDWVTVDSSGGMSKEQLESISTDQWNAKISGLTDFIMRFALQDAGDTVTQIKINFTN